MKGKGNLKMEKDVVVLIGAGSIGIACARRIATGKHLIIGDINSKTAKKVEEDLYNAGEYFTLKIE